MNFQFIKNLQNKPEPVKKTIMWTGISLMMFVIFLFWLFTFPFQTSQPIEDARLANLTKEVPSAWQTFKNQFDSIQNLWQK
ncbi:MAG: hypothetical protein Q7S78_00360 [Candidatus Azambacteria bacterium]|nr:hypothetical protein [Candidatus Azambacteria bacterium]